MSQAELVVAYNAVPTANRVARARQTLVFRAISAVISLVVLVVLARVLGQDWSPALVWGFFSVWAVVTVVWFVVSIVTLVRARSDMQRIGAGAALVISPAGVRVAERNFAWPEVVAIKAVGNDFGAGPRLVVETAAGRAPASH